MSCQQCIQTSKRHPLKRKYLAAAVRAHYHLKHAYGRARMQKQSGVAIKVARDGVRRGQSSGTAPCEGTRPARLNSATCACCSHDWPACQLARSLILLWLGRPVACSSSVFSFKYEKDDISTRARDSLVWYMYILFDSSSVQAESTHESPVIAYSTCSPSTSSVTSFVRVWK